MTRDAVVLYDKLASRRWISGRSLPCRKILGWAISSLSSRYGVSVGSTAALSCLETAIIRHIASSSPMRAISARSSSGREVMPTTGDLRSHDAWEGRALRGPDDFASDELDAFLRRGGMTMRRLRESQL
jgi:hypothetical protein